VSRILQLFDHFGTRQGPCRAGLHKWGLAQSPSCDCGQRQTMNHIVNTCPLTKFEVGLNLLYSNCSTREIIVIMLQWFGSLCQRWCAIENIFNIVEMHAVCSVRCVHLQWKHCSNCTPCVPCVCLQCFDTVGWVAGRAYGL